jgi:hypothetical protein
LSRIRLFPAQLPRHHLHRIAVSAGTRSGRWLGATAEEESRWSFVPWWHQEAPLQNILRVRQGGRLPCIGARHLRSRRLLAHNQDAGRPLGPGGSP